MSFAEKMIESMVDENGHCGERGLSAKQFGILQQYLYPSEIEDAGYWEGDRYGVIKQFTTQDFEGNIGKYHVKLNEFWHFHPRHTVVSIDLRPAEEIEREAWLKSLRDFSKSEWQGQPKERKDFELTYVSEYEYDTVAYCSWQGTETHYIYTFTDGTNCYVWKTTNLLGKWAKDENGREEFWEYEAGDTVKLKATIKEHTEYKGIKQTVLTRAKVM